MLVGIGRPGSNKPESNGGCNALRCSNLEAIRLLQVNRRFDEIGVFFRLHGESELAADVPHFLVVVKNVRKDSANPLLLRDIQQFLDELLAEPAMLERIADEDGKSRGIRAVHPA